MGATRNFQSIATVYERVYLMTRVLEHHLTNIDEVCLVVD
jgi:hypothetical protein